MRFLITGARGHLGAHVLGCLRQRGHDVIAWSGQCADMIAGIPLTPIDLRDHSTVREAWRQAAPDVAIHAAAITSIAQAFQDPGRAQAVNVSASALLAELAAATQTRLVYLSTDLVFDGEKGQYSEDDPPRPTSIYGQTKQAGEAPVLATGLGLVLRLSLLYGPSLTGRPTFFEQQCDALRQQRPIVLFDDEWRTPLSLPAAAAAIATAATGPAIGVLHLGGPERLTRYEMGLRLAQGLGVDAGCIVPRSRLSASSSEPRPKDTSLDSRRFARLFPNVERPTWEESLKRMSSTMGRSAAFFAPR